MLINSYRTFRREREREFDKIIEGFTPEEDKEFESMCNSYLSNDIKISDFDNYLNRSLFLNINESSLSKYFDEYGNLINYDSINEEWEWLDKAVNYTKDKSKSVFNIASAFFKSIIDKVKNFVKKFLVKFSTEADKMMDLVCSFFQKMMSGLKYFGDFMKKKDNWLYKLLVKISVSLGITSVVSYLLSLFGPTWVAAMGAKTGASMLSNKLKVGDRVASKILSKEQSKDERKIQNYSQFINEAEEPKKESTIKKVGVALGSGIIKFFKILRTFKIAILIFLGAVWIIGSAIHPMNELFSPIFEISNMSSLGDVFRSDFVASAGSLPSIKVSNIEEISTHKVDLPKINDDHGLGVNDIQTSSSEQLNAQFSGIKSGITEHPKEFSKDIGKLFNDLKENHIGKESNSIDEINTDGATPLTQDQVEQTTGADDVDDLTTHQGGCFVAGTLVTLSNGQSVNIEDVKEGDMVITYNIEKNIQEIGKVKSLIILKKNDIVSIKLSNSANIECTSEHPFWVVNKGWSSISPEKSLLYHDMNIEKMIVSDILLTDSNIEVIVDDIKELKNETINVYNLQIEGHHNYYANGILVHNKMASDGDDEPRGILKNLKKNIKDKSDEIKGDIKDKILGSKEDPSNVDHDSDPYKIKISGEKYEINKSIEINGREFDHKQFEEVIKNGQLNGTSVDGLSGKPFLQFISAEKGPKGTSIEGEDFKIVVTKSISNNQNVANLAIEQSKRVSKDAPYLVTRVIVVEEGGKYTAWSFTKVKV